MSLSAVSRCPDMRGTTNLQQLWRQNLCSCWTSVVELTIPVKLRNPDISNGRFRRQLKGERVISSGTMNTALCDLRYAYLLIGAGTEKWYRGWQRSSGCCSSKFLSQQWTYCYCTLHVNLSSEWALLFYCTKHCIQRRMLQQFSVYCSCPHTRQPWYHQLFNRLMSYYFRPILESHDVMLTFRQARTKLTYRPMSEQEAQLSQRGRAMLRVCL